jgi:ABC-type polysaccharide/polyol phosphate transport system, ATPase component
MSTIISVENLSKQYRIGTSRRHNSFRDIFDEKIRSFFKAKDQTGAKAQNTIWALQDVSFDVQEGEVLGIIGRNGAGKSTLLKILSRITEPTKGLIRMKGRVASLLEVGTGFSGELTGRENIFLNGAILGMKRAEIKRKFDEIVAFAEIEKFIDTPVKRYSSGMYMRLAFAIAAHLEPEILIVDEVLAVGDAEFQKKCLGKMKDVSYRGRTVLFVSHNMKAVRQLCSHVILLRNGAIVAEGPTYEVTEGYLHEGSSSITSLSAIPKILSSLPTDETIVWKNIDLLQDGKPVTQTVLNGRPLDIVIDYRVRERAAGLRIFFDISDEEETILFRSFHDELANVIPTMEPGDYKSIATIPADVLAPMKYDLGIYSGIHNVRYCNPTEGIHIPLFVEATGRYNQAYLGDTHRGKLGLALKWKTVKS